MKSIVEKSWFLLAVLSLTAYTLSYVYRWDIGLVLACANCQYFYYSEHKAVEPIFHAIYYPVYRIHYWLQEREGIPNEVYYKERKWPGSQQFD